MHSIGVIFKRTLYDTRIGILGWGIGIGLMAFYVCLAYPMIQGMDEMANLMESPIFQALLGDVGELDWTTPQGFLGIEFFSWIPLMLAVYAVLFAINITSGEESRGTMDILLSTPTPRWQIIVEKYLAFVAAIILILVLSAIGLTLGIYFTPELQTDTAALLQGMLNIMPPVLFIGSMTLLLSTVLQSPSQAGGLAAAVIVASYFLNSLAQMTESSIMEVLQSLSFYKYYDPFSVVADGIQWGNFMLLIVVAAGMFMLSLWTFNRRDITV